MFAAADVLVIALPLINATRGLIGARELSLMKPAAILVNLGRAAIVDERALYEHLRRQPDFCAGIDAWWHEPGPDRIQHQVPVLRAAQPARVPAQFGRDGRRPSRGARRAAENVRRFLDGEAVIGVARREDYL